MPQQGDRAMALKSRHLDITGIKPQGLLKHTDFGLPLGTVHFGLGLALLIAWLAYPMDPGMWGLISFCFSLTAVSVSASVFKLHSGYPQALDTRYVGSEDTTGAFLFTIST